MNLGFHASGEVFFGNSLIDNDLDCSGGSFTHNKAEGTEPWAAEMPALFLGASRIQGPIWLSGGFQANGAVDVNGVTCTRSDLFRRPLHQPRECCAERLAGECFPSA